MGNIDRHYSRELISIEGNAPARDAARLMLTRRIGAVAVRENGRVVGLVSERDLMAATLERQPQHDGAVSRWMRRNLPSVSPRTSDLDCVALMRDHNTRHLLVAENARVVGIVSMRDVLRLMLDEKQYLIDQLQSQIARG
jgi:CBS domain-containing protein